MALIKEWLNLKYSSKQILVFAQKNVILGNLKHNFWFIKPNTNVLLLKKDDLDLEVKSNGLF